MRAVIVLTNYNMPERADAIAAHLERYSAADYYLIVVDNGSDMLPPPDCTTVRLEQNRQTMGGWLAGVEYAEQHYTGFDVLGFCITSMEFAQAVDPLTPLLGLFDDPNVVGVSPALTLDSSTNWLHMLQRPRETPRNTWMIDNIFALWRRCFYDSIGGFDPALTYAWGPDLETSYLARKRGYSIKIDDSITVRKTTNIGYDYKGDNRMRMTSDERNVKAYNNMADVLMPRYGGNWLNRMKFEYVSEDML